MPLIDQHANLAAEAGTGAGKRGASEITQSRDEERVDPPAKVRRTHRVRTTDNAVATLLKSTTLWDVVSDQHGGQAPTPERAGDELLVFYHNETVEHALKKLAERHVNSAPVLLGASLGDGTGEAEDDFGTFMGMVDTHNLLKAFISTLRDPRRRKNEKYDRWQELDAVSAEFLQSKLITICDDRDVTEMFRGGMDTTIHESLTRGFLSGGAQPHRICLFNLRGHVSGMVTQSDVIAFLYHNVDKLGGIANQHVRDLPGFLKPVSIVEEDIATIDAFERMYQREVTGLAVVDGDTGKLVGNISAGDLRGLRTFRSRELGLPVREFLRLQHERDEPAASLPTESDKAPTPPRRHVHTLTMEGTLRDVLRLLSCEHVPRVYIVDVKGHAVGVATHTDVLHALEVLEVL